MSERPRTLWPRAFRRTAPGTVAAPQRRIHLGGIWFDNLTMADTLARITQLVAARKTAVVVTPNVDHVVRFQSDAGFASIVRTADLVLADGQPVVWASRLLGTPLQERVAGSDLLPRLCEHAAKMGFRVFFLGGQPGAAAGAKQVLEKRFPGLEVVGTYCPPMGFDTDPLENRKAVAAVRAARPHLVFVGLGSPKQERWIAAHQDEYGPAVSLGIGISFSFVCGQVRRAPVWMQRSGLEWLHRLCKEPKRLWRRYLVAGWGFLPVVWREWWRGHPEIAEPEPAASSRPTPTSSPAERTR